MALFEHVYLHNQSHRLGIPDHPLLCIPGCRMGTSVACGRWAERIWVVHPHSLVDLRSQISFSCRISFVALVLP